MAAVPPNSESCINTAKSQLSKYLKEAKMNAKKGFFYLLAVLFGGCVPVMSLHPLFNEKDVVFDKKLLGTWVDDPNSPETTWDFKWADGKENAYRLIFTDKKGNKGLFIAHLVKLKDKLFLDACPPPSGWEGASKKITSLEPYGIKAEVSQYRYGEQQDPNKIEWSYNYYFMIPVHTFIKINSIEPQLKIVLTDDDKMKEFLKADPNAVKHTVLEDKPVLTASTNELQAFVLKYADDTRVFAETIVLDRKKTTEPNAPPSSKRN